MLALSRSIDTKLKCLLDQMPGFWGCKDKHSTYTYVNKEYGHLIGLSDPHEMIGKTDFDIPCDTAKCADIFISQDKKVMQTAKCIKFLDIHPYANNKWKALIFTKSPLRDENNQIIGTIFHGEEIANLNTIEIGSVLAKAFTGTKKDNLVIQDYHLISPKFNIKLTDRQSQVLFFLLRGKTIKQIAHILGKSNRTIDDYLEQLRIKFSVNNKYELIEKSIGYGFLNIIPESLFKIQLSIELNG